MFAFRMAIVVGFLILTAGLGAQGQSLLRVERRTDDDLTHLQARGISVVGEFDKSLMVWGEIRSMEATLDDLGYVHALVDRDTMDHRYWVAGLLPGWTDGLLSSCGEIIWAEDNWILMRTESRMKEVCVSSPTWMLSPMPLMPYAPPKPPPAEYARFADGSRQALAVKPLVEDMVAELTSQVVIDHWTAVIGSAATRYSTSAGCQTAAEAVYAWFDNWGLQPEYQAHTSGHAPNVIGTLPGLIDPSQVYIVIGHLDDLPSSGPAPGADDNASGSATVVALADVMSQYGFAYTVKFLAVTGEEFGLYGSTFYAEDAFARGEDIRAVLNADMTGWEGDGSPNPENLDLNFNGNSEWLGNLFAQLAVDYQTGCVVDAFSCPGLTASDHAPFWSRGWSAVCGITDNEGYCGHGGHYPYYHTSDDTLVNCGDTSFFISTVRAYLATLAHLADPQCVNPDPPTDLTVQATGANEIALSWTPAGVGDTFDIFRAPGGCGSWSDAYKIGETAGSQWLDDQASGQILYGYFVFSKDATGICRSSEYVCAEGTTTGDCLEPPIFHPAVEPINLQETACGIEVDWATTTPLCGTQVTYNVYRDEVPDFTPSSQNLIAACLSEPPFVDRGIQSSTDYFYLVRAEDNSGHGSGPCSSGNESFNLSSALGIATGPDTQLFADDVEDGASSWVTQALPGDSGTNPWEILVGTSHSPAHAWFCADENRIKDQVLMFAAPLAIPAAGNATLHFWHQYDIETRWDGGVLEYSTDLGSSWNDILDGDGVAIPPNADRILQGAYSATLRTSSSNPLAERQAWTGSISGFEEVIVDLSDFNGTSVLFRWRMGCDSAVAAPGWWVDDISVIVPTTCNSGPCDMPDAFEDWWTAFDVLDFIDCWRDWPTRCPITE